MGMKIEWEGENLQSIQLKEGKGEREEEGGRGNIGTREKGTCPRARSKLEVRRGLRCSFPKTICPPLSPQADYRSRSPNPAFPASAQEARGEVYDRNALINRRKE